MYIDERESRILIIIASPMRTAYAAAPLLGKPKNSRNPAEKAKSRVVVMRDILF